MSTRGRKSSAAKNVLIFFIVIIIIEMLIVLGTGRLFKDKNSAPSVAGMTFFLNNSSAMGKSVPDGALVAASNMTPSKDKIGKAVLCKNVKDIGTGVFWLCNISSKANSDGVTYTVYQGENTTTQYDLTDKDVIGVASSYYKTAGTIISFIITPFGIVCCAAVPLLLLVIIELIIAIATHSSDDDDADDNDDDEKDEEPKNVKLDDFLFGGQNETETIAKHKKHADDAIEKHTNAKKAVDKEIEEKLTVDENDDVDRSYYERASHLLDEATTGVSNEDDEPVRMAKHTDTERTEKPEKSVSASLEDLMKLMDEEQEKLRKTIKDNNDDK